MSKRIIRNLIRLGFGYVLYMLAAFFMGFSYSMGLLGELLGAFIVGATAIFGAGKIKDTKYWGDEKSVKIHSKPRE